MQHNKTISIRALFAGLLLPLMAVCVFAGDTATPSSSSTKTSAPAELASSVAVAAPEPAAAVKANPEERFQFGFDERFRTENWNNLLDASDATDDERHQARFRTHAWLQFSNEDFGFYLRLTNEFKKQNTPDLKLNLDEVFFDSLYLDIKKLFVSGLALRVGRQDLALKGDGLIFSDPSANDGSRSFYYNAVDLSYSVKRSKFELLGILDPRKDRFLPIIHDQHKYLNEWDDQAVGLYYTDRNHAQMDVDAYFFHKKEIHDYRAALNPLFQPDRHVETSGVRLVRRLPRGFTASEEAAYQWGAQHPNVTIRGWMTSASLKRQFNAKWKPYVLGGYTAYSGDDPKTADRVEGWDPIFSRYPKWSDLYFYSLGAERGLGYWSNMGIWQAEAGFSPAKWVKVRGDVYRLDAWNAPAKAGVVFGTGTSRGTNFLLRSDFAVRPGVKGHLQYERLLPGDFYSHQAPAYFLRGEISYEFKGGIGKLGPR